MLYARFWHKVKEGRSRVAGVIRCRSVPCTVSLWLQVLYDLDLVKSPEPFAKLVHQGMILGEDGEKMSNTPGDVVLAALWQPLRPRAEASGARVCRRWW